jgi:3',5'-cyclic AMP phosphodiesterase CpdA
VLGIPVYCKSSKRICPLGTWVAPLLCVSRTGDLATTAVKNEFDEAEALVQGIATTTLFGRPCGLDRIFLVPGNHDVVFEGADYGTRWQPWAEFTNRLYDTAVRREKPWTARP